MNLNAARSATPSIGSTIATLYLHSENIAQPMKFFMTIALLCLWCFPARPQPRSNIVSENARTSRATADAKLQLTTEIVKAQYFCAYGFKLDLELTFTNVGPVPVILSKKSVRLASYLVSRNVQTASDRQYEQQGLSCDDRRELKRQPCLRTGGVLLKMAVL